MLIRASRGRNHGATPHAKQADLKNFHISHKRFEAARSLKRRSVERRLSFIIKAARENYGRATKFSVYIVSWKSQSFRRDEKFEIKN